MRYLIVGCGRVGSTLALLLEGDRHDVIVVDENPSAFKRLGDRFHGAVVVGTGIDYDVLRRAGAAGADGFVAVTNGDNRNVMAALIAQRMFHIKNIVARIYDPTRGMMYRDLGIETVCPTTVGARMIRDVLLEGTVNSVRSVSATVRAEHAGKRVTDVERAGHIRIATIEDAAGMHVAQADRVLAQGDTINAVVTADALSEFTQTFTLVPAMPAGV